MCRHCGKPLPWAKVPKTAAPQATKAVARDSTVARDYLVLWAIGIVVFLFAFSAPMIGYFMTRFLNNTESEFAGFATAGMYLGVIVWGLGFISLMSQVDQTPTQ